MGKLYVVPTPIGNLKDITLRALDVLREVNYIACEDTRRTRVLLNHYEIKGTVSDPGFRLVRACIKEGIEVEVLPGASALITALVGSGLPTDRFLFAGFPPKKGKRRFFEELSSCKSATFIIYESPKRLVKTLWVIEEVFGDVWVCVARELTKVHEEYIRGDLSQVIEELERRQSIKGEVVVLFREKGSYTAY